MFNVAIVEDDDISAEKIRSFIEQFEKDSGESFCVSRFCDGEEIIKDYKPNFQIIFLDIQMKKINGMETAEKIRETDQDVILIFITNMAQYAIKGYSVNALDFLVKPVSYFAFSQQLKRSVTQVESRQASYILIPSENSIVRVNAKKITFIESFGHQLEIHSKDGDYTLTSSMTDMEKKLVGRNFFRCGKSYLVNLAYVTFIKGGTVMIDKKVELSIGRAYKKSFVSELAVYMSCRKE